MWVYLLVALVSGIGAAAARAQVNPAQRAGPNILFVMTDDHAAHAISAYGSTVNRTPHLDRLAAEGVRFDNCFVTNSICTPSRATLLTGKYSHLNGVPVFNRFDGSQPHVAKYLQAAGYHTAVIGKWHLGSDPTGFDHWEILPGQGRYVDPVFYTATDQRTIRGYATDVITDLAIQFLQRRPKDKPFFLMCHHKAPHREWTPDEKHRRAFAVKTIPEPATLYDDYATRSAALRQNRQRVFDDLNRRDLKLAPPAGLAGPERERWLNESPREVEIDVDGNKQVLTGDALNKWKYQRYMQDYLACVQSVDDSIGRLLDYLDQHGLRDNTVVIYTSDQGFFLGDHGLFDKRFMYEPSLRMPLLVRAPGVAEAGQVATAMAINTDFAPTFLDLAGVRIPPDMQGRSLVPLLKGQRPADWRTSMYYRYYHDPGHHNTAAHYGVRTATHKLVHYWKQDQWELFDLTKDPQELHNLYSDPAAQQLVTRLKAELRRLKAEVKDEDQFTKELPPDGVDGPPPARRRDGTRPGVR